MFDKIKPHHIAFGVAAVMELHSSWQTWRQLKKVTQEYSELIDNHIALAKELEKYMDGYETAVARLRYLAQMIDDHGIEISEFDRIALTELIG